MSKDMLEGTLKQLGDALRQRREVLTDKDLGAVDIDLDRLPGLLQARCGHRRQQAEKEIAPFLSNMGPEGKSPVSEESDSRRTRVIRDEECRHSRDDRDS